MIQNATEAHPRKIRNDKLWDSGHLEEGAPIRAEPEGAQMEEEEGEELEYQTQEGEEEGESHMAADST
ncbi:hypothetical protein Ancab_009059, partial [Ancistrocladus abbreviatus]